MWEHSDVRYHSGELAFPAEVWRAFPGFLRAGWHVAQRPLSSGSSEQAEGGGGQLGEHHSHLTCLLLAPPGREAINKQWAACGAGCSQRLGPFPLWVTRIQQTRPHHHPPPQLAR